MKVTLSYAFGILAIVIFSMSVFNIIGNHSLKIVEFIIEIRNRYRKNRSDYTL